MRTYPCGHPNTVENTTQNGPTGTGRCRTCHNERNAQRYLECRIRNLPGQLDRARARVAQLEADAARYGFHDLVERRA